ncbi:shikimate dehydrogenase [Spirochaetes bacterium]|uniref:Shikimate dehydrogenase (NADP(+)) n=1 Tax=Candidatus Scatousia excrementipullorum TaxID=2840936 RepID=A0A9D9DPA3_9BACT|nr:shikimate dehydrogenase [Candidatus Scatousia excrementipullorum]
MNKFGLIGYPLGHSLSAVIHKAGFESLGIDATYDILETDPEDLVERVKFFKRENYSGFNVTIPLKLPISLFVQEVDKYADIAGAVNTVKINSDKTFKGYNTDAMGFKKAIPASIDLKGADVALLGTGGASRAAVLALSELGVKYIGVYTRNIPNAMDYMAYMRRKFPNIEFESHQIDSVRDLSRYNMLVNTTPIGMLGRSADMTPIEENVLKTMPENSTVYDVIYNPKKTVLLKLAENIGLNTINGLDMFIYQAIAAQEIWLGKTPDFKTMKIAALENL